MRISDWSSDVCSSDLQGEGEGQRGENRADSQRQEQLRRQLGDLMRELGDALGEIPRPLGRAEREMRDARDALDSGQPGQAVPPQTRSLDQLQQGMQATLEQFMEMFNPGERSEESTTDLKSLMRISYAVYCL